jgi:hypothetical protein
MVRVAKGRAAVLRWVAPVKLRVLCTDTVPGISIQLHRLIEIDGARIR